MVAAFKECMRPLMQRATPDKTSDHLRNIFKRAIPSGKDERRTLGDLEGV